MEICPLCSYFKLRHPELPDDCLSRPYLLNKGEGRIWIVGCQHTKDIFGPHETEEKANEVWAEIVSGLMFEVPDYKMGDIEEYNERMQREDERRKQALEHMKAGT